MPSRGKIFSCDLRKAAKKYIFIMAVPFVNFSEKSKKQYFFCFNQCRLKIRHFFHKIKCFFSFTISFTIMSSQLNQEKFKKTEVQVSKVKKGGNFYSFFNITFLINLNKRCSIPISSTSFYSNIIIFHATIFSFN